MKKFLSVILSAICCLFVFSFTGCKKSGELNFYAPDGAPALSISKLILDKQNFGTDKKVNYNIVKANAITSAVSLDADFIILPVLTATKIYNGYKTVAVITHGNFYIDSSFQVTSLSDLKGKVVLIPQNRNTVPDLTLKAILKADGIEYVDSDSVVEGKVALSYKGTGSAVITSLPSSGSLDTVAYMPEPASTTLKTKKTAYSYTLNVQTLYDSEKKSYPQAVLLVKESVLNGYADIVNKLKEAFNENANYIVTDAVSAVKNIKNVFSASELPDNLTTAQISGCNIYWQDAKSEKQSIINYITKMKDINKDSASLSLEGFFYE